MSREIDAEVAEKVVEWSETDNMCHGKGWKDSSGGFYKEVPNYSTDISAAWEVVEKLTSTLGYKISLETYDGKVWTVKPCGVSDTTAPMAICKAALKAVEVSNVSIYTS